MNKEETVCSLEQAIILTHKYFGFRFETINFWVQGKLDRIYLTNPEKAYFSGHSHYPAYCSAELDRMLHSVGFGVHLTDTMKYDPEDSNNVNGYTYDLVCLDQDSGWDLNLSFCVHNGAIAKAQGLIWLLDETIVEAKDILL